MHASDFPLTNFFATAILSIIINSNYYVTVHFRFHLMVLLFGVGAVLSVWKIQLLCQPAEIRLKSSVGVFHKLKM